MKYKIGYLAGVWAVALTPAMAFMLLRADGAKMLTGWGVLLGVGQLFTGLWASGETLDVQKPDADEIPT